MSYIGNEPTNAPIDLTQISASLQTVFGLHNRIINGNFDFWQRGTTSTATTGLARYLADRWRSDSVGSTINPSRQAFTIGQTSVPYEPTYFHRSVVASVANVANYAQLGQYVESVRSFAGQKCVLSFWAKADASKNIAVEFAQSFGTGGSPSSAVTGNGVTTIALTTSWQQFKVPVTLPSISGKTLGTNGDDCLQAIFWFDAGSNFNARTNSLGQQSGTFDISQVQLEPGSVASIFAWRPPMLELSLCQRYYEKSYNFDVNPGTVTAAGATYASISTVTTSYVSCSFRTTKRATPTMTFYSPGTGATGSNSGDNGNDGSASVLGAGVANVGVSMGNGTNTAYVYCHWTANAEL